MAKYRDEVEAARLRADTLEAELAEQAAKLTARDAALAARDARINELQAKLERQGDGPAGAAPKEQKKSSAPMYVASALVTLAAGAAYINLKGPADVALTVQVSQAGMPVAQADVYIDGQKVCEFSPCQVTAAPGKSLQLRVRVGEQWVTQSLTPHGDTTLSLTVPEPPPKPVAAPPKTGAPPKPADTSEPDTDPDADADPGAGADAATGTGTLNINTIPPSQVIIDGRPYGKTPVTNVKLKTGTHTVVLRHPKLGTQSRAVTITKGKTRTLGVRFDR